MTMYTMGLVIIIIFLITVQLCGV